MKYSIDFINKTINKVKCLLDDNNINYYIVGVIGAYIDANLSISRIHDDLDIMIEEKYIDKLKSIFSDNDFKFYDNRLKSNKVLNEFGYADGDHEVYVTCDNFHIGFILYEITDDSYSFIDYLKDNKILKRTLPIEIFDYQYNREKKCVRKELIYKNKKIMNREKDIYDLKLLKDYIDNEKLNKLKGISKYRKTKIIDIR